MNHIDPISLEVYKNLFISVAEEMGVTLNRTAYSPNIKERRDFSCACFLADGQMIAQAAHIPVHLGAMPASVRAVLEAFTTWSPGDLVIMNDPYLGGTHLPDITMVSPVFIQVECAGSPTASLAEEFTERQDRPRVASSTRQQGNLTGSVGPLLGETPPFFVASRAHHADVGGMSPGSMALANEIYQEGLIIPPVKLVAGGRTNESVLEIILRNVRTPRERRGDLAAQIAAHRVGEQRLREIVARYGLAETLKYARALLAYAERLTRTAIRRVPDGVYVFRDEMDDSGTSDDACTISEAVPAPQSSRTKEDSQAMVPPGAASALDQRSGPAILVTISVEGDGITVDLEGTSPAVSGPLNAVRAITESAAFYAVHCVAGALTRESSEGGTGTVGQTPVNSGTFAPVRVLAPRGSILDAEAPHAVAGGNVETSQRVVDVVLGALANALPDLVPAASQGTMNNLAVGGFDSQRNVSFAYYETLGGGAGAGPAGDGLSGVHVHMTNTLNTPVEALEYAYPLLVRQYALRRGSGGAGLHCGGDGLVRDIEFLCPATVTILSERRRLPPYGLRGGEPGARGENSLIRDGQKRDLPGKVCIRVEPGDVIRMQTPGGGGWGAP